MSTILEKLMHWMQQVLDRLHDTDRRCFLEEVRVLKIFRNIVALFPYHAETGDYL